MRSLIIVFFLVFSCFVLKGQDVHFTQSYAAPQNLNPALSGNIEGTYRIMSIYKDQWRTGLELPMKSYGVGGDTKFNMNFGKTRGADKAGLGVFFYTDRGQLFKMNTNKLGIQAAYHKLINRRNSSYLSAGVEVGVQQRNINYDNLNFGDEFNEINAFDQTTSEILPPNNFGFLDLGLGVTYSSTPSDIMKYHLGFALHHFNRPSLSFFAQSQFINPDTDVDYRYAPKFTAHGSFNFKLGTFFSLSPRFIYIQHGNQSEADIAANVKWDYIEQKSSFHLGLMLKSVHGVDGLAPQFFSPMVGFEKNAFLVGLSYDVYMGETLNGNTGLNAFELSLRFIGEHENEFNFCPEF